MRRSHHLARRSLSGASLRGLAAGLAVVLSVNSAFAEAPASPPPITVRADARVPLRDGISLHAVVYRPETLAAPRPGIVWLTPYGADGYHREAFALARRGFTVAMIDVRGRGGSGGEQTPWRADGRDGADAVEWLAHEPGCDGRVAIVGYSYGGRAVWSVIRERPAHLVAAADLAASYPMWSWRNIQGPDALQWLLLTGGAGSSSQLASDPRLWDERFEALLRRGLPLRAFDRLFGTPSPLFHRFLDHPTLDEFWEAPTPTADDYRRIAIPILSVGGLADGGAAPTLFYYRAHAAATATDPPPRHRLLVGPWDHRGVLRPTRETGGRDYGAGAALDMMALVAGWLDAELAGTPPPAPADRMVAIFDPARGDFRGAGSLAELAAPTRTLVLAAEDAATPARPGALAADGIIRGKVGWTDDPRDLSWLDREPRDIEATLTDCRLADDLGRGAVFDSAPAAAAGELSGPARFEAWIALDVPDSDFEARLLVVAADGTCRFLGADVARARHRESLATDRPLDTAEPLPYRFEWSWISEPIAAGDRLRLVLRTSLSLYAARNYNGAGPVADQSLADAHVAHPRIVSGPEQPSRIELAWRDTTSPSD